jgi:hypothetical protein
MTENNIKCANTPFWHYEETGFKLVEVREECWKHIGFSPELASGISMYSLTPDIAKKIGKDLMSLCYIGKTTIKKLEYLTKEDCNKWFLKYNALIQKLENKDQSVINTWMYERYYDINYKEKEGYR